MNIKENIGLILSIIGILLTISIYGIFFGIPITIIGIYYLNKKANGKDIEKKLEKKQKELDNIDEKLEELEKEKSKEIDEKLKEKRDQLDKLDSFDANYRIYRHCGFAPVSYCKFDKEFAPEGWKKDRDKEESIIFFKYIGKESKYESVDDFYKEVEISKDYDQAIKDRELRWDDAI